ncbi:MAG: hypothetical protein ACMXX5_01325 [Candidatus Woesearchaeota archaeon]
MKILGKSLIQKEDYSSNSVKSMLREMENRLTELEHEVWSIRLALNEATEGKSELLFQTAERPSKNIDSILVHEKPDERHIRQAREFINTMIENDKNEILRMTDNEAKSLVEFIPKIEQELEQESSEDPSKNFFNQLESENLLKFFIEKENQKTRQEQQNVEHHQQEPLHDNVHEDQIQHEHNVTHKCISRRHESEPKRIKLTKESPHGKEFFFSDGSKAKTLHELYSHLIESNNDVFVAHVCYDRNDFVRWINDVLGYHKLAGIASLAKTKEQLINLLKEVI